MSLCLLAPAFCGIRRTRHTQVSQPSCAYLTAMIP
ncbi:MAG TPA: hypothetical protein IAB98_10635 [Candidatus Egerieimonas intestinavium]|uniref:Uncharacterized protein n=1 Tax=Candidatus Egerieimonas intestinavium TaxID=2840777 RepID=A0A9D1EKT2_9FIRM|nr:hypothetical protein [Candidatus Egerieimonas intestinavium]